MRQTFRKYERLSSKKIIDRIFQKGSEESKAIFCYPFRILYLTKVTTEQSLPAVMFSISKRNFKKSVERNLLRRRMREAYRRNKMLLLTPEQKPRVSYLVVVYVAKEKISFEHIEKKLKLAFKQIEPHINEDTNKGG